MISAIHKETGKIVNAELLSRDASWLGTENNKWLAPNWEILNNLELKMKGINEVEVSYVKKFKRVVDEVEQWVRPHFRKKTSEAILREEKGMSEEHKLCEEKIYNLLWDGWIKFIVGKDIKKITDYKLEGVFIEERFRTDKNTKIADVLVKFKNENPYLGKGICFEIQFSKQSEEATQYRTWKRLEEGYSVVWLFRDDFDDDYNLKKKNIKMIPISELKEIYQKELDKDVNQRINAYGRILDKKLEDYSNKMHEIKDDIKFEIANYNEIITKNMEKYQNLLYEERDRILKEAISQMKVQLKNDLENAYQLLVEESKEDIYNKISNEINKRLNNSEEIFGRVRNMVSEFVETITAEKSEDYERIKEDLFLQVKQKIENIKPEMYEKINEDSDKQVEVLKKIISEKLDYNNVLESTFKDDRYDFKYFVREYLNMKIKEQVNKQMREVQNGKDKS